MPLTLIDRIETVDPVVIAEKTPEITQVLSADLKSSLIPTPVIDTLYKTGAQTIRIRGNGLPVYKMTLPNTHPDNVKLILVTVDSNSSRSEAILSPYVFKASEKELVIPFPNDIGATAVDGYIEFRHGMTDRPLVTYDIAVAAAPT